MSNIYKLNIIQITGVVSKKLKIINKIIPNKLPKRLKLELQELQAEYEEVKPTKTLLDEYKELYPNQSEKNLKEIIN